MSKESFIVTGNIVGHARGSVVELTAEQAGRGVWNGRVRKADVSLVVAQAPSQPDAPIVAAVAPSRTKDDVIKELQERGIAFDGRRSLADLEALLVE